LIYWPQTEAGVFDYQTNHTDLVPTLMSSVLGVKTAARYYAQGHGLLEDKHRETRLTTGEQELLLIFTQQGEKIVIDPKGRYSIINEQQSSSNEQKLDMKLFLQLLTENRRF